MKEQLRLEVGKSYITRKGYEAKITAMTKYGEFIGIVTTHAGGSFGKWSSEGCSAKSDDTRSDLMAEFE
jgi:hypothetical protein